MTSSRIAFCSRRHGKGEIYLMDPEGNSLSRVTENDLPDLRPHFSWDGQTLFASDRTGQADIHAMGRDESDQRPLEASDAGGDDSAFSPDGQRLPCTSQRDGETAIYIMRTDGTQARRVTPEGFVSWQASFSPDASQLVFTAHVGDTLQLHRINAEGSGLINLSGEHADEFAATGGRSCPRNRPLCANPHRAQQGVSSHAR